MKNALSKLFEFLGKANSEAPGEPSSARLNIFIAVVILVPCIAFTLIYVVTNYPEQIQAVLNAILLFVAGLYAGKVIQRTKE
jgi:hypothetical protein